MIFTLHIPIADSAVRVLVQGLSIHLSRFTLSALPRVPLSNQVQRVDYLTLLSWIPRPTRRPGDWKAPVVGGEDASAVLMIRMNECDERKKAETKDGGAGKLS
jgi:hypothetical protein